MALYLRAVKTKKKRNILVLWLNISLSHCVVEIGYDQWHRQYVCSIVDDMSDAIHEDV